MSSPLYTNTFNPPATTLIRAGQIKLQLDAIEAGLDIVYSGLAAAAPINSPALTGAPTAPTPPLGDASARIATTDFVAQLSFASALPGQTGSDGNLIKTRSGSAFWSKGELEIEEVTGTSVTAVHGKHYILRNAAKTTVTAMASPAARDQFRVTPANGRFDNEIAWNGSKHENLGPGAPENVMVITSPSVLAFFIDATFGFKVNP